MKNNSLSFLKGFTLVELIVVITILAILGTIAFISLQGFAKDTRNSVRIADLNSIERVLSLYEISKGRFPAVTDGVDITFSGATIWTQGTFGEETRRLLLSRGQISEIPRDPLTGSKYTYSILNTGREFSIAAVFEGELMVNNNLLKNTYAAGTKHGVTYIKGNYNGMMARVSTGSVTYVLAVPTIINGNHTLTDIIDIITANRLVFNKSNILPSSYSGQLSFQEVLPTSNIVNTSDIVAFSGASLYDLKNEDNITQRNTFIINLQLAYTQTPISNLPHIESIVNLDTTNTGATEILAVTLVNSNLGGNLKQPQITLDSTNILSNWRTYNLCATSSTLCNNDVRSIIQDSAGNMWFGTQGGVFKFDGTNWTNYTVADGLIKNAFYAYGLANNDVKSIIQDSAGNMWFGVWFGGVSKFDGTNWTSYTTADGLVSNTVRSIIQDSAGNMWFGTFGGGVSKFDGTNWTSYTMSNGLPDNNVSSITQDSAGNMWFGTFRGGVSKFDGTNWTSYHVVHGLSNNVVNSTTQDSAGNMWFGTSGLQTSRFGGVSKFDGTNWTRYNVSHGLINNTVRSIIQDSAGNMWFGTNGGVSKFDGTNWTSYTTEDGLAHNAVRSIIQDSAGNMWFGTAGGVSKFY